MEDLPGRGGAPCPERPAAAPPLSTSGGDSIITERGPSPGALAQHIYLELRSVLWTTAIQKHVPREILGRVISIDFFGGTLLLPLAPIIFAAIVAAAGPAVAFVTGGAIVVGFLVLCLFIPSLRDLE